MPSPTQHEPAPSAVMAPRVPKLLWSEYCYLGAVLLALLVTISLPEWGLQSNPYIKHLPLLLTIPAVVLSAIGQRLNQPLQPALASASIFGVSWPFILLAAMILVGSLHARMVDGVQSTFANVGLYMLMVPLSAAMVTTSRAATQLVRAYMRLLMVAGALMAFGLCYYFRVKQVFHEQIFLLIPLAVLCMLAASGRVQAWLGCILFLGTAILSAKNTSYIIALLMVLYLTLLLWLPKLSRASSLTRLWANYVGMVLLLLATVAIGYVLYHRDRYLPSGNVTYRAHTYALAWQEFQASPLWGNLFNTESVKKFGLYDIGIASNRLPTHSDVMDLLANGGVLAVTLLLTGYWRIARLACRELLAPQLLQHPVLAQPATYAHTLAMISLAACVTYTFNPILLQAPFAYLVWTNLGLLLGMSLRAARERQLHELPMSDLKRSTPSADRVRTFVRQPQAIRTIHPVPRRQKA